MHFYGKVGNWWLGQAWTNSSLVAYITNLYGQSIHKRSFKATYYSQTPHPGNYTDYSLCGEHM